MQEGSRLSASENGPIVGTTTTKDDVLAAHPHHPSARADTPGSEQGASVATNTALRETGPSGYQTLRAWLRLARASYLIVAVAPVLVTAAWLWSRGVHIALGPLIVTGLGVAAVQAGALLLDAYTDRASGKQMAQEIAPDVVLRAAISLLALGACLGVPLALAGGAPVLLLGGAALLAAVSYSATPYALKRLPLGELAVALALGPGVVALTVLAQRQPLTPFALALGAGLGLFAAALVEAANLRALVSGIGADRHTLARMLGAPGGRLLYAAIVVAAYLVVLIAAAWPGAPHGALGVLFSLPVAILPLTGALRARAAATLTPVVTGMLRAYAYFAFWLVIGLLLGALYLHLLRVAGS